MIIYLLNGPGLAPQKSHILQLGHSGRFAMNIVDDLIVVHHQASATSLLFDIKLTNGTVLKDDVVHHTPVTLGRPIKPFPLQVPSLSLDGKTKNCELCMFVSICSMFSHLNHLYFSSYLSNRFTKLGIIPAKHSNRCKARLLMVCETSLGFIMQSDHRSCKIGRITIESNKCKISSTFNC